MTDLEPAFPPEIEQIIFSFALDVCGLGGGVNLLVARRFHDWLMPRIMKTLTVQIFPVKQIKYPLRWDIDTLQTYGTRTRSLFIWIRTWNINDVPIEQYLSLCPNITDLALWTLTTIDKTLFEAITRLPLRRLSIDVNHLPSSPKLFHLFSRLTHLDCLNRPHFSKLNIPHLTSLTHLALPEEMESTVQQFLQTPTLEVLVLITSSGGDGDYPRSSVEVVDDDFDLERDHPGVVKMRLRFGSGMRNWVFDVQEGRGMWGIAEEVVTERITRMEALNEEIG